MTTKLNLDLINQMELGYLHGLFMGDGYQHYDRKQRHYVVEFYLNSIKDVDIIKQLTEITERLGLNQQETKIRDTRA